MKNEAIPRLRFKGFNDRWCKSRLYRNVNDIGTGKSNHKDIINNKNSLYKYPVLGSRAIIGYSQTYDYYGNMLLIARVGAYAGNVYKFKGPSKITDNTIFIKTDNSLFIAGLLNHFDLRKISFGSGRPLVKSSELRNLKLNFPSLPEQQLIGKFFAKLDKLIQLQQKKVSLLKELKQGYLQKLFPRKGESAPRLRFKGFHDKWMKNTLGELGNTFTSLTGKNKKDFGHGKAEYIPYMNIHDNPIALRDYTGKTEIDNKQNQVKKGDIFFTTSSETPEEVGFSSVWIYNTKNVYLNSFSFGYRLKYPFDSYYMGYALRTPLIRSKIYPLAQGISRYNLSKHNLMKVTFEYPSLKEQSTIGYLFKYIDNIICLQINKLENLQKLKKAYLQKMFC